jgi:hypothetical protein
LTGDEDPNSGSRVIDNRRTRYISQAQALAFLLVPVGRLPEDAKKETAERIAALNRASYGIRFSQAENVLEENRRG